ncbi:putative organic solute transporter subunit alpha/Transmembrane protein [Helianthus annuus]|uniref:Organic solute transporter subunit alpha/Transmembrane protein n=1 Tax=Helianthus annuus TaxID=4232 RepID=A0A251V7N5_HELAN|nr:transmembrane protein 184 homolog DDB_G0279555 [Helianthus annuus]KAF5814907.1 putative organic solute transporter subunit alpha/Transmembrane protein [Helianthus annuus]KAJ0593466.1 putative organic solute transporter subunit alpha/Transmembrane protein [Helianthus annuus]KAJ0601353.1 putative organic solute transporter subunit alpha/Transmembrane protein [Helianthus annuus]KAJ0608477.1 putative organic solute transporter subunit alpha/Transmembrane protein [Helianthus annuus]KAJ0768540.1 
MNRKEQTLFGSGACVAITVILSLKLLIDHVLNWKKPKEQKAIVVIILMAPIYAIDSYVGLIEIRGSETFFELLDSIKECYEALVMAKFLALLYTYLDISISKNIVPDDIKGRVIHHSFPMTLFQPHKVYLNHHKLKLLKYWTWQFVVIRPVCSVVMIVLQLLEIYPDWLSWTITIILNISVSLALYALVAFYHVFAKELAPHNPLAKFLCVKGIVFFCYWQGVLLSILAAMDILTPEHYWLDAAHVQQALQNILVVVEMIFFSIFQMYAYSAAPYKGKVVKEKKKE